MEESDPTFEGLLTYIKEARGFDFTGYKRPSLMRRIGKRMGSLHIQGYENYLDRLQADPDEFTELFNTIMINVTGFFRDPPVWDHLASEIIPRIVSGKHDHAAIRVWCAGSASGEEAYSIAMLLSEHIGPPAFRDRVKIFATDVDEEALTTARHGRYREKSMEAVPEELRRTYFRTDSDGLAFAPELRRSIIFGRHDLVQDAPISHTDLILCRNTIMYMNADTQSRVISNLAFSLNDGGFLVLGKSEMLFSKMRSFVPVDMKCRVFIKADDEEGRDPPGPEERAHEASTDERLAFDLGPVAQVMLDKDGKLSHVNRRARDVLSLSPQDVGKEFDRFEFAHRPIDLRAPIEQSQRSGEVIGIPDVASKTPGGREVIFDIQVVPLVHEKERLGTIVTFTDVTDFHQLRSDVERSDRELTIAMEELQSTNEELETTNEELQSTNEELETTNEELQSTNEELETTNEELQSTNDELETMNEEMSERSLEVAETDRFMNAVMASVHAAVVVLGPDLRIRVWNGESEEMWGLAEHEVKGKLLQDLDIGLPVDRIGDLIRGCLMGNDEPNVVVEAIDRRGRSIRCRVSCSRLGSSRDEAGGVVLVIRDETITDET
jgi:two-component system, chemotaxis family, CheB/CheR fusion protein